MKWLRKLKQREACMHLFPSALINKLHVTLTKGDAFLPLCRNPTCFFSFNIVLLFSCYCQSFVLSTHCFSFIFFITIHNITTPIIIIIIQYPNSSSFNNYPLYFGVNTFVFNAYYMLRLELNLCTTQLHNLDLLQLY